MADLPSAESKINDVEVTAEAALSEAFFTKVGSDINFLIDAKNTNTSAISANTTDIAEIRQQTQDWEEDVQIANLLNEEPDGSETAVTLNISAHENTGGGTELFEIKRLTHYRDTTTNFQNNLFRIASVLTMQATITWEYRLDGGAFVTLYSEATGDIVNSSDNGSYTWAGIIERYSGIGDARENFLAVNGFDQHFPIAITGTQALEVRQRVNLSNGSASDEVEYIQIPYRLRQVR